MVCWIGASLVSTSSSWMFPDTMSPPRLTTIPSYFGRAMNDLSNRIVLRNVFWIDLTPIARLYSFTPPTCARATRSSR
jgi:hypothetical protein